MKPSGMEPATFWLVAQCLNQLPHTEKRQSVKLERNENPQISSQVLHLQTAREYQKKERKKKRKVLPLIILLQQDLER